MKRKGLIVLGLTAVMTSAMGLTALAGVRSDGMAGNWKSDANGWWWQNSDGTWPANGWVWLDGNDDGRAECYYFNENGYILTNTTSPDGYTLDADGAWTVNGEKQTQTLIYNQGWNHDGRGWKYYSGNRFVTSDWEQVKGKKYYFDENGYMVTGFNEIDGLYYYFESSGALKDETFYMDGIYYVVDSYDGSITDEIDEYDWADYRQDYDTSESESTRNTVDEEERETDAVTEDEVVTDEEETESDITEAEAQEKILALESSYPEGMKWDNSNRYASGNRIGYGCAGFAYLVQDSVFGKNSNVTRYTDFDPDNLHIGDHIRIYNNAGGEHSVIVLDVLSYGVELVEGNYNSSIHWGRTMSFENLEENFIYQETRY